MNLCTLEQMEDGEALHTESGESKQMASLQDVIMTSKP